MKTKTIIAAIALTLAPTITLAMGCNSAKHQQAASCASGSTWSAEAGECVADANA